MKTNILFAIIVFIELLVSTKINSQTTYYDAIKLKQLRVGKNHIDKTNILELPENDTVYKILSSDSYIGNNNTDLCTAFDNNPFIRFSPEHSHNIKPKLGEPFNLSSIGGLDVTNFADGMAKFIVKRTKQELSTAFFERFKQDLDNNKQIQILFPATYNALKAIDQEIYNYSAYLDLLRESFQKDLVLILPDIIKLINDPCMNDVFITHPEIKIILSDALYITNEFSQGKHPGEIIHDYITSHANNEVLNKIEPNLYPSLQTLDLFSQSLRSKQANQYWISPDSLKLLFDDTTLQIYLGLIYQQASLSERKIIFNETKIAKTLESIKKKTDPYRTYLTGFISRSESANYYFKAIKNKQLAGKDKPTYQDYYSLFDASLNLLEYLADSPTLVNLQALNKTDKTKLNSYFTSARSFGNIYVDIYEKQYASAIVELCNTDSNLLNSKVASLVLKYGSFAASLAKAENSDDIENTIEAVALPSGSSRIKRESKSNVSINAYCGLYGGKNVAGEWSTGLTAPIGIAASWGIYKHTSLSLFLSIIDLGTPVAFRFSNTSDSIPAIKLADIISPGLFLSLGTPKSPISINVGCQMTPLLTSVSTKESAFGTKSLRVTLALCIDLPLLTLYNKSK